MSYAAPAASDKIMKKFSKPLECQGISESKTSIKLPGSTKTRLVLLVQSHINVGIKRENVIWDETYKKCALIITLWQL